MASATPSNVRRDWSQGSSPRSLASRRSRSRTRLRRGTTRDHEGLPFVDAIGQFQSLGRDADSESGRGADGTQAETVTASVAEVTLIGAMVPVIRKLRAAVTICTCRVGRFNALSKCGDQFAGRRIGTDRHRQVARQHGRLPATGGRLSNSNVHSSSPSKMVIDAPSTPRASWSLSTTSNE